MHGESSARVAGRWWQVWRPYHSPRQIVRVVQRAEGPPGLRGRDILEAAALAVVVALALKMLVVDFCYVPSLSMAPTLLPGDYVIVSKLAYALGFPERMPVLSLRLPREIRWWYRLPERWDVIVLDFPGQLGQSRPEIPQYYVKRVVGLPGDTLRFSGDTLWINRTAYLLPGMRETPRRIIVPARGMTFPLSPQTLSQWMPLLLREGLQVEVHRDTVYVNGKPTTSYTMPQNYFFVMGDNYPNSSDSRSWGVVPQSAVIGKAVLIYYSVSETGRLRWSRIGRLVH